MKRHRTQRSAEQLMRNTARLLIQDFQNTLSDPGFCSDHFEKLLSNDLSGFRKVESTLNFNTDVCRFKRQYQVEGFLKRYRFKKDLYDDQELIDKAISTFLSTNDRIRNINLATLSSKSDRVLDLARMFCQAVLGRFDDEQHRSLCRFGKRASVGVPAREACEAARWQVPISGSLNQINWFLPEINREEGAEYQYLLNQGILDISDSFQLIDHLKLVLVPKSWKSLRSIMPNTTIGSYMTYGIGEYIRKRLKRIGFNISTLQMEHRHLARLGSIHRKTVTADLSSASDSISVGLVQRLIPRDWFEIMNLSRIGTVMLPNGVMVESETFSTMGIGFTFPLQTLIFLALIWACLRLDNSKIYPRKGIHTLISVYGDDLIYPIHIHKDVAILFKEVGFVLNEDKTFVDVHFRESCGGDYYHGVDVRPFSPENGPADKVPLRDFEALVYKLINGLLRRWDRNEVPLTLEYLIHQCLTVTTRLRVVPGDFGDHCGIRVSMPLPVSLRQYPVVVPKSIGHGLYRFSSLDFRAKTRKEDRHEPYYWCRLRGGSVINRDWSGAGKVEPKVRSFIDWSRGCDLPVSSLEKGSKVRNVYAGNSHKPRKRDTVVDIPLSTFCTHRSGTSGFEAEGLWFY